MAFSSASNDVMEAKGGAGGPEGQIRSDFPETWMWRSAFAG